MSVEVTRAVIPAAGLGTRFLPATKAVPKEMLPLLDRPGIQYAVEEAASAGIGGVVVVTAPGRDAVRRHFSPAPALEDALASRGEAALLQQLLDIKRLPRPEFTMQENPRGLGHAVSCARPLVGDTPFAVLLPDELLPSGGCLLRRMMDLRREHGGSVVALMPVEPHEVSRYGIVKPGDIDGDVCVVEDMVEKPAPDRAPSNLAIIGRYIISPSIFPVLDQLPPGTGGEIQLTDGLKVLIGSQPVHGVIYSGVRFDTGTVPGYLAASIYLARGRPGLWSQVCRLLEEVEPS